MRISPDADVEDGKITLCLVNGMSRIKTMLIFPSLLLQIHRRLKAVWYVSCESFTVRWHGEETLCMDGNLYRRTSPVTFEVMPGALALFADG
jgi:diacylglycerol kinase family enzyme